MFIGIWVGATIIHHFNPIDGLIGSFTGYLVPSIADSWNAGMLIIMALIGGFMYMLSACGGAEAFGRWAEKVANNRKKSQLLAWIAPFVFIFNQGCLLVGVIMRPVTDKTHISRVSWPISPMPWAHRWSLCPPSVITAYTWWVCWPPRSPP